MRSWFVAFTATVLCALSLGLFGAPAGATDSSTTAVADNSSGLATGGNLTFTATVTGDGVTPTGTVAWTVTDPNGAGVACPDSTLDGNGEGTCTVTDVIAGTYSASADYSGDSNYGTSSGQDTTASISKAASSTSVNDNAAGVATGGSFHFTATVTGAGVTPTGTISWTVTDPNGHGVSCAPSTLDGNGEGTCTVTDVIAGTYSASADYSGDSNYGTSSGQDTTASISKAASSTSVNDNAAGVATGGSFTFTATVSGPGVTPTGTVTWTVTDPNGAGVACAPSTLDDNGQGTCTVTNAIAGTYSAIAAYTNGDANYTGSSGEDTASVGEATSATEVADDSSGVATGGSFSFTATVTGAGVTPTGTVIWTVTDPNGHGVSCAPSTLDGNGMGTCTVTDVIEGTYSATAHYGGDSNYGTSSGQDTTASISKAASSTSVNDNAAGVATGGSFHFTATVTGAGVTPTGTISWTVTDPNGHGVSCAPSTLDGNGEGTCTVTDVIAGTYSATAHYGGDPNYDSSSGHDMAASISKAASSTGVNDNAAGVATGGSFHFTATVTGPGVTPTGSVTWTVTGPAGPVSCAPSTLDGNGMGTCTVTDVIAGTYSATAHYGGDTNYGTSSGLDTTASISKATSSTTVNDNAAGVATGGSFHFTATVTGPGVTPTGSVTWTVTGPAGPVSCAPSTLDGNGMGTCTVTDVIAGTYSATAHYGGDTNYGTSSGLDTTASISKATSSTTVNDNAAGVATGGSFHFTATVTGPGVTPTGSVTWTVTGPAGPVSCAPSTLDGNGMGTCTVTDALPGDYSATAHYGGNPNYDASSGQDTTASISKAASSTGVNDNAAGVVTGGTFAFSATVSGPSVTPTGSVTWTVTGPAGPVSCAPSTLDGNGEGTCTVTDVIAGTYSATAHYGGDSNYGTSSGQDTTASISKAATGTTVNDNAAGVVTGGSFRFTATVTGAGVTPTGTVTWIVTDPDGQPVSCAPSTLDDNGVGTCTVPDVIAGTYSATAHYSGDINYDASSGQDTTASISKAASSTGVVDTAAGVVTGGTFAFSATVSGPGVTPTGSVTWTVTDPDGQAVTCAPSALNGSGMGTCNVTDVIAGTYSATAHYGGDTNYDTSSGPDTTASISKAASSTGVVDTAAGVVTGGTFAFSATVSGPGVMPTSTITWTVTGPAGPVSCPPSTLDDNGMGTCTITHAMAGNYSATAHYGGDTNYDASSGQDTTAHIGIAAQTIIFTSTAPNAVFAGPAYGATAQSTSGLAVVITSSTTHVCSISSGQVSFDGVGTCTLNANQEGDAYWSEAVQVTQTFQVNRATPSSPTIINIPTNATEFGTYVASVSTSGDGASSVTSISTAVCTVGGGGHTVTFVGFGVCTLTANVAQGTNYLSGTGTTQSFPVNPAARGYWLVGSDGGIFSFGAAAFYGSMGGTPLQRPVVGITPSASRTGYWLVASDGGIFSFGNSSYYGSIPGVGLHPAGSGLPNSLNAPIVGMVPSVTGHGYFMVASDGGVFAFGDAHFAGSCPGIGGCAGSAVSVMPDSTGKGYWLVTNVGAVYAFGDAQFYGAPPAQSVPVVDAVPSPDWRGYWLLYANGDVDGFGDATTQGAPLGYVNGFNPASAIFPTADGKGYWVASGRGDVFAYGDAPYLGSEAAAGLNGEIIAAFGF